jgi:hypothetical protein
MKAFFRFVSIVAAVAALILIVSCSQKEDSSEVTDNKDVEKTSLSTPSDSLILEMVGVDSMTVLDILLQQHEVTHMSSLQGAYITMIDNISNEGGYFWMYSVNEKMGEVACDKYTTKNGDLINWHYRMAGSK